MPPLRGEDRPLASGGSPGAPRGWTIPPLRSEERTQPLLRRSAGGPRGRHNSTRARGLLHLSANGSRWANDWGHLTPRRVQVAAEHRLTRKEPVPAVEYGKGKGLPQSWGRRVLP